MMTFGALVIPGDLAIAALDGNDSQGWLGGASIQTEGLFVATTLTLAGETKYSAHLQRVLGHRATHLLRGGVLLAIEQAVAPSGSLRAPPPPLR